MAESSQVGLVVSAATIIGTILTFLAFWTRFTDKIAIADKKSDDALQEAAEAKNDFRDFRESLDEMNRDIDERIERMHRDDGESLSAIRRKVTEVELFMRDNFVRNVEFSAAMNKIEAGQIRTETKLDRLGEQMHSIRTSAKDA